MAKILLVEDDNNLREIFEMRLQAEGYDTKTASDGEEALAVAIKEKPDLIIADVMMPKMSGFEMLENLRGSPDMANTKVIMMTALGQAEDRERGEKLGVIKYLVKSQVTLEDFVRTVREVAGGPSGAANDGSADGPSNANNNLGGDKNMDDGSQPTNPAPAGGDTPAGGEAGAGANPISGGADGQMSSAQAQDSMNNQVNDAMGGAAAPAGDGVAAPAGDDAGGTPADVPMSPPPADPADGDGTGGDAPQTPPAEGQGGTPAAPGGM